MKRFFGSTIGELKFEKITTDGLGAPFKNGRAAMVLGGWIIALGSKETGWSTFFVPDAEHIMFEVKN